MQPKILVIIPAYNEEESILYAVNKIRNYNKENKTNYDVIVINDGSTDMTEQICLDNDIPMISLIHNLGIGGAVQTGYKYAYQNGYDIALQFDGDGQHEAQHIKTITTPIINGEADFVIGSRFVDDKSSEFKSSRARRMGITLISKTIRLKTGKTVLDVTSGFRAANKEIIKLFANNYPIDFPEPITNARLSKMSFRLKEVPVEMVERNGGVSSIRAWKTVYFMLNVLITILFMGRKDN